MPDSIPIRQEEREALLSHFAKLRKDDAEELVQELCCHLLKPGISDRLAQASNRIAWLKVVATNLLRNSIKRENRYERRFADAKEYDALPNPKWTQDDLFRLELRDFIEHLKIKLSPEQRMWVQAIHEADGVLTDAAERLGLKPGEFRAKIQRLRNKLRAEYPD